MCVRLRGFCVNFSFRSQAEPRQSEGKAEGIDLQRRKEEEQKRKSLELHLVDTVDGRNPANQLIWRISGPIIYSGFYIHPSWCQDFFHQQ